jgi:hypothetical protein
MPAEGNSVTGNPNVCPSCALLLADLASISADKTSPSAVNARGEDTFVPRGATQYGGTFVWGSQAACGLEQGS